MYVPVESYLDKKKFCFVVQFLYQDVNMFVSAVKF